MVYGLTGPTLKIWVELEWGYMMKSEWVVSTRPMLTISQFSLIIATWWNVQKIMKSNSEICVLRKNLSENAFAFRSCIKYTVVLCLRLFSNDVLHLMPNENIWIIIFIHFIGTVGTYLLKLIANLCKLCSSYHGITLVPACKSNTSRGIVDIYFWFLVLSCPSLNLKRQPRSHV